MRVNKKYIGCNYNNGVYYGGIISSFNGSFHDEEVLISNGIGDIIPCVMGNVSECYSYLKDIIKNNNANSLEDISASIFQVVDSYFNGISNLDKRFNYYKSLDDIHSFSDISQVSSLKGTGAAMCVERAMLSHNLLKSLGINSYYKCSGIIVNNKKDVHSYNIIEYKDKYYIFDTSMPCLINGRINPLITDIPKYVFDNITSPLRDVGYSVNVSHYNPIRDKDIDITYDSMRKDIYYCDKVNVKK